MEDLLSHEDRPLDLINENMLQSIRSGFNKAKLEEQSMKQLLGSKKDITLVTMNTHGRGVLGLTPQYKLEMIRQEITLRIAKIWCGE